MEKWHIHVGEARTQIEFAKRCYAAYLDAAAGNIVSETFFQLRHFIVHAVNVDKLLDAKPGSKRGPASQGPRLFMPTRPPPRTCVDCTETSAGGRGTVWRCSGEFIRQLTDQLAA
jgi:hypothetical protein